MRDVLLVDGVGNGVVYRRLEDHLIIEVANRRFEKMREYKDGLDIYRLVDSWRPDAEGIWPKLRHVNRHLAPA